MDAAWNRHTRPERHRAAVPYLQAAVQSFFGGQFGKACQALDEATAALEGRKVAITDAIDLRVSPIVIAAPLDVSVSLTWAYKPVEVATETWEGLPLKAGVPFTKQLRAETRRGGRFEVVTHFGSGLERSVVGSFVSNFETRLKALEGTDKPAVTGLVTLMKEGLEGKSETVVPFADAMALAETYQIGGKPKLPIEIPLAAPGGVRLRAWIPSKPKAIVIALHGAGGSENMFFESYGAGKAVSLAQRRQWVFIAPRLGTNPVTLSLDWLKKEFGITDLPVFLMGHSMGGGVILQTHPSYPKAIALFAPAANQIPNDLLSTPTFLAVGAQEMMMLQRGIERINEQLKSNPKSESKTYPNCEHLMIVADAIDDAYDFFDRCLKR